MILGLALFPQTGRTNENGLHFHHPNMSFDNASVDEATSLAALKNNLASSYWSPTAPARRGTCLRWHAVFGRSAESLKKTIRSTWAEGHVRISANKIHTKEVSAIISWRHESLISYCCRSWEYWEFIVFQTATQSEMNVCHVYRYRFLMQKILSILVVLSSHLHRWYKNFMYQF
jgi:hypothetical protein